nr:hypothetical protein CFP56_70220 [Quercus suber]
MRTPVPLLKFVGTISLGRLLHPLDAILAVAAHAPLRTPGRAHPHANHAAFDPAHPRAGRRVRRLAGAGVCAVGPARAAPVSAVDGGGGDGERDAGSGFGFDDQDGKEGCCGGSRGGRERGGAGSCVERGRGGAEDAADPVAGVCEDRGQWGRVCDGCGGDLGRWGMRRDGKISECHAVRRYMSDGFGICDRL